MPRTLVLYFSVTGHTEALARAIGEKLGADVEAIRPRDSYSGALGAVRGIWQHITATGPSILAPRDPSPYELVVVGTPVWGGRLCAPVRSYLRLRGGSIQRLAGFWVSASGQAYTAIARDMEQSSGRPPVATQAFGDRDVESGQFEQGVAAFVARIATAKTGGVASDPAAPKVSLTPKGPVAVQ